MIVEYFRCYPAHVAAIETRDVPGAPQGFFKFGEDTICYGRCSETSPVALFANELPDVSGAIDIRDGRIRLPFDLRQVVDNLRHERYLTAQRITQSPTGGRIPRKIYYFVRPILPVQIRKHLQKARLRGWEQITFPRWPVDLTVDTFLRSVLGLVLKATHVEKVPFIWFWPDGAAACAIMTHDVETLAGRNACDRLMDLDHSVGIQSAFQLIPEVRYAVPQGFLNKLRQRGFEVNVHDLNHDGLLFQERQEFLRRAAQINRYVKEFQCEGFRAGAMYRNQEWFDAFEFSYDMSVPNVAHLEPQRGGCCTVMPFFIGKILELPMTTTQDYSLFHILGEYSIKLWKEQIDLILQNNGLMTFGCHPDYLMDAHAEAVYIELLQYLAELRAERHVWMALPAEVNRWWRDRQQMNLVPDGDAWRIEGPGKDRARIAYAYLENNRVVYSLDGGAAGFTPQAPPRRSAADASKVSAIPHD